VTAPLFDGYFADPFVLRTGHGYVAYGTNPAATEGDRVFEALESRDLRTWTSVGAVLIRPDPSLGSEFWAPEVVERDGTFWMYYSVGHGIRGHHIRVARSSSPHGPFTDADVNLTPAELFAIDAHPFQDADGEWYLFFARDRLTGERPGTALAVDRMLSPTQLAGEARDALVPFADWQLYEARREMYGATYDWHTLEGPSVIHREGQYWLTYSGGSWEGDGYGVSWASARHPLGPWVAANPSMPRLLSTDGDLVGPGHNCLVVGPNGDDVIVFHAWNDSGTRRELHAATVHFDQDGPHRDAPW
jgi:beta-xylosidase